MKCRCWRVTALLALTLPLLSTGTCVQITQESLISGFFNAVNPIIVDYAADQLGLTDPNASG